MAKSSAKPAKGGRKLGFAGALFACVATVALAVTYVALGFAACLLPPATHALSSLYAEDNISPLPKQALVAVADATRDYSFASHDQGALLQAIYDQDVAYAQELARQGTSPGPGFPRVSTQVVRGNVVQLQAVFDGSSELYSFSPDTIAHLDDCYAIARYAYPILGALALLAVAGCIFAGRRGGKRKLGAMLLSAGAIVIVAFAALGIWAAVDFDGFFAAFHGLFFSQGNWTFPYDSLLICSLPTAFWVGMGAIWLLVTVVASILSLVTGRKLCK